MPWSHHSVARPAGWCACSACRTRCTALAWQGAHGATGATLQEQAECAVSALMSACHVQKVHIRNSWSFQFHHVLCRMCILSCVYNSMCQLCYSRSTPALAIQPYICLLRHGYSPLAPQWSQGPPVLWLKGRGAGLWQSALSSLLCCSMSRLSHAECCNEWCCAACTWCCTCCCI